MASQFGRKPMAITHGAAVSDLEARRAAFVAAERRRRIDEGEVRLSAQPASGAREIPTGPFFVREEKSIPIAYLLWFLLGGFSAHRFYVGATASACVQLFLNVGGIFMLLSGAASNDVGGMGFGFLMMASAGIWLIADIFLIPGLCRRAGADRAGSAAAHVFS
ncbi:MAG TPA: TM2 domain-containing protein [Allosphingosinicella sp.]|jgi:hypothetical protein|nr:TM2 domain-containing protein [Allosphingosinicella sp.]